jgi:hypothetical protein
VLACRLGRAVVVSVAREQDKRRRRRRADRPSKDDEPRKIADACFCAADAGDLVGDEASDTSCVIGSRVAVAINSKVSRSNPLLGCDRPPDRRMPA